MWIYNTLTYASLLVYLEQFIDKIYSIVDLYLEQRVGCVMLWFPLYKLIVRPITAPSICSDQNISPRFLIAFQTNFTANLYTNFPLSRFFLFLVCQLSCILCSYRFYFARRQLVDLHLHIQRLVWQAWQNRRKNRKTCEIFKVVE